MGPPTGRGGRGGGGLAGPGRDGPDTARGRVRAGRPHRGRFGLRRGGSGRDGAPGRGGAMGRVRPLHRSVGTGPVLRGGRPFGVQRRSVPRGRGTPRGPGVVREGGAVGHGGRGSIRPLRASGRSVGRPGRRRLVRPRPGGRRPPGGAGLGRLRRGVQRRSPGPLRRRSALHVHPGGTGSRDLATRSSYPVPLSPPRWAGGSSGARRCPGPRCAGPRPSGDRRSRGGSDRRWGRRTG